jgi:NAD/NADP transhydrogenase alpha subunit
MDPLNACTGSQAGQLLLQSRHNPGQMTAAMRNSGKFDMQLLCIALQLPAVQRVGTPVVTQLMV